MFKAILKATLIAGLADITGAFVSAWFTSHTRPDVVLKYIASGITGKEAFEGGYGTMALGLGVHFMIAFACAAIYFLLYPKLKFLQKSIVFNIFLVAVVAWLITTQVIVPLSRIGPRPVKLGAGLKAISILVICIGTPIVLIARNYFKVKVVPR